MNEYSIREVWGSRGAPTLGYIKAESSLAAIVAYLTKEGYSARIENGDLITQDDAPSLRADLVTRNVRSDEEEAERLEEMDAPDSGDEYRHERNALRFWEDRRDPGFNTYDD